MPFLEPVFERMIGKLVINPLNRSRPADIGILQQAASTFVQRAATAMAAQFVRDGTWQVPTLIRLRTMHRCDDIAFAREAGLRYIAPSVRRAGRRRRRSSPASRPAPGRRS